MTPKYAYKHNRPRSLPAIGDAEGAWNLYARTCRPGRPLRHTGAGSKGVGSRAESYIGVVRMVER